MSNKKIVIMAVGGQGNLLISKILGEAAIKSRIPVRISEVHGMAQRGGVVECDVVLGEGYSSTVSDEEADILVAFEPLEAVRAMGKCHFETLIITNTVPVLPFTITTMGAVYPEVPQLIHYLENKVKTVTSLNAALLAEKAGAAMSLNMVMLGVLAKEGNLPLTNDILKETIAAKVKSSFKDINLQAFDLGFNAFN